MDGWSEEEFVTAPATERSAAPPSLYLSARAESLGMAGTAESGEGMSSVEEDIERSKSHWSELSDYSLSTEEDSVATEIENREVFRALQSHPQLEFFFHTFGYDTDWLRIGELVVGEKFAEGGQAELFHAHITWRDLEDQEYYKGDEWVLKVFKKGTLLRHLQSQWPQGYFQYRVEVGECNELGIKYFEMFHCAIQFGILLEDGRFAFLIRKEEEDLRHLIDRKMLTIGKEQGPFSKVEAESIMYSIACGMEWLHKRNIVHRDLKASNVLFTDSGESRIGNCCVADFECSIGVVGTGFWRAPEILQACKERNISQRPELFTKSTDVYSYGMTCYEILTGKVPFGDHPKNDYDLVLNGQLLELPEDVDNWMHGLLMRCWHPNPAARPSFGDILHIIENNSIGVLVELEKLRKYRKKKKAIFI